MIKHRLSSEEGFTLIELLVVILIIGILAAIALPTFLNQQRKGQDAGAKSNARNAATQMETCFADTQTYEGCSAPAKTATWGLPIGGGTGQVEVTNPTAAGFTATARSESGCSFILIKSATGTARSTTGSNCSATSW